MGLLSLTLLAIPALILFGLYRKFGNPLNPKNVDWRVTALLVAVIVGILLLAAFGHPINQPEWLTNLLEAYSLLSRL
ncbi:MAG: hypothetical protein KIH01_07040 [Candidatus Freyarchaeota archaeon]|nr:hypothetical protein [Candidatus Jordarchaeia archaeon]